MDLLEPPHRFSAALNKAYDIDLSRDFHRVLFINEIAVSLQFILDGSYRSLAVERLCESLFDSGGLVVTQPRWSTITAQEPRARFRLGNRASDEL